MKNLLRRPVAFMLIVCMLLSVMPPVNLFKASAVTVDGKVITYDIDGSSITEGWTAQSSNEFYRMGRKFSEFGDITPLAVGTSTPDSSIRMYRTVLDDTTNPVTYDYWVNINSFQITNDDDDTNDNKWAAYKFSVETAGSYDLQLTVSGLYADVIIEKYNSETYEDQYVKGLTSQGTSQGTHTATIRYEDLEAGDYVLFLRSNATTTQNNAKFYGFTLTNVTDEVESGKVIAKIEAIGEVTADDKNAITDARTAYDNLTETQKALVTNIDTLTAAEVRISEILDFPPSYADGVYTYTWEAVNATDGDSTDDISDTGWATAVDNYYGDFAGHANSSSSLWGPQAGRLQIKSARVTGYTALRFNVPAAGTYKVNLNITGGAKILDIFFVSPSAMATGNNVKENNDYVTGLTGGQQITVGSAAQELPKEVTFATAGDYLMVWRLATGSATGNVNFYGMTLTDITEDVNAAAAVIEKINAIGTVDELADETAITDAREAYDALTEDQKALISEEDLAKLTAAEKALAELKVNAVIAQINAIGTVELSDETAIKAARAAYNALTDAQKALISDEVNANLTAAEAELTAAETELAELKLQAEIDAFPPSYADGVYTYKWVTGDGDAANNGYPTAVDNYYGNFAGYANNATHWKPQANNLQTQNAFATKGAYLALRFNVPAAGVYDVAMSMNHGNNMTYSIWFKPLSFLKGGNANGDNKDLVAGLTDSNASHTSVSTSSYTVTAEGVSFDAAGDYLLILRNDTDYETTSTANLKFSGMTLTDVTDQLKADEVIALIDAIDTVTLDSEEAIVAAENAYDNLTETQKTLVTNYETLTDARTSLDNLKAADAVINKINAIGEVTLDSEAAIKAARTAYDELTDAQKALVTNIDTLTTAETDLAALKLQAEIDAYQPEGVDGVYEYTFTFDAEEDYTSNYPSAWGTDYYGNFMGYARSGNIVKLYGTTGGYAQIGNNRLSGSWYALKFSVAKEGTYNIALNIGYNAGDPGTTLDVHFVPVSTLADAEDMQAAIDGHNGHAVTVGDEPTYNLEKVSLPEGEYLIIVELTSAPASNVNFFGMTLTDVTEDVNAAAAVIEKINAIGEVTLDSEDAIKAARTAYDALTEDQKALVTNIDTLTAAETELAELKLQAEIDAFPPKQDENGNWVYTWTGTNEDRNSNGYASSVTNYYGNFAGYANTAYNMYKPYNGYLQIHNARTAGEYLVLRINVPAEGTYNITFNISSAARAIDVFFVSPSEMTTGNGVPANDEYVAALTGGQQIIVGTDTEITKVNFQTAGDYLMVWRLAGETTGQCNFSGMTMSTWVDPGAATVGTHYDFTNFGKLLGSLSADHFDFYADHMIDIAEGLYNNGDPKAQVNYLPYAKRSGAISGDIYAENGKYGYGIFAQLNGVGGLFALRIKSPGAGTYTFNASLTAGYANATSKGQVYIIPISTVETAHSNLLTNDPEVTEGDAIYQLIQDYQVDQNKDENPVKFVCEGSFRLSSVSGEVVLDSNDEDYIVVFYAAALRSGSGTTAWMHVKGFSLTNQKLYYDLDEALAAAGTKFNSINLTSDQDLEGNVLAIQNGTTVNLNGFHLNANVSIINGSLEDSSGGTGSVAGLTGAAIKDNGAVLIQEDNVIRAYDYTAKRNGYKKSTTDVNGKTVNSIKFWFDADFAESVYEKLIDGNGVKIGANLTFVRGTTSKTVEISGLNDAIAAWRDDKGLVEVEDAKGNKSNKNAGIYVEVVGIDTLKAGDQVIVTPTFSYYQTESSTVFGEAIVYTVPAPASAE